MAWYVVRTNIKSEEKAAANLRRAGYNVYLPMMKIERQHKRTKKWLTKHLCLFPRYLFLEQPEQANWFKARMCQGVESVLGICGTPVAVPGARVERMIRDQAELLFDDTREAEVRRQEIGRNKRETTKMRFPVGTKVRAKDGPFAEFRGLVTSVTGKGALEVMLNVFGRLTPVAFPVEQMERVNRLSVDEQDAAA